MQDINSVKVKVHTLDIVLLRENLSSGKLRYDTHCKGSHSTPTHLYMNGMNHAFAVAGPHFTDPREGWKAELT